MHALTLILTACAAWTHAVFAHSLFDHALQGDRERLNAMCQKYHAQLDTDNDGFISVDEWTAAFAKEHIKNAPQISAMDADGMRTLNTFRN
jgi:hypothetical protein